MSSPPSVYTSPSSYPSPQSRLLDALFSAHFERGLDISSPALLVALAEDVGVSRQETQNLLANDVTMWETDAEAAGATQANPLLKGAPTFIIQGKWLVGGVQEPEVFLGLFEKAATRGIMSLREVLIDETVPWHEGTWGSREGDNSY